MGMNSVLAMHVGKNVLIRIKDFTGNLFFTLLLLLCANLIICNYIYHGLYFYHIGTILANISSCYVTFIICHNGHNTSSRISAKIHMNTHGLRGKNITIIYFLPHKIFKHVVKQYQLT